MEQDWFEMVDLRRRRFSASPWVPLRVFQLVSEGGISGHLGHTQDFLGVVSLCVPPPSRTSAEGLEWGWSGLDGCAGPHIDDQGNYVASDVYAFPDGAEPGFRLAFEQRHPGDEPNIWHLHQDFVLALGLIREGDVWLRPDENYRPGAKVERDADGEVCGLYANSALLRDYLCARNMALRLITYRQRTAVMADMSTLTWPPKGGFTNEDYDGSFEGRVFPIHSGGMPAGTTSALFHVERTDVDVGADVPEMSPPTEAGTRSTVYHRRATGPVIYRVEGCFKRDEWIEPAAQSPRVKRDFVPSATSFLVDGAEARVTADDLNDEDCGVWLWFDAAVMRQVLSLRNAKLTWYSRHTGSIRGEPGRDTCFGVNKLGLINTYASDVAKLSEWLKVMWAAHNVGPDGGVCEELTNSQARGNFNTSTAPEIAFRRVLERLDEASEARWGRPLFNFHKEQAALLDNIHRFRSADRSTLLAFAKDIERLAVERLNVSLLHQIAPPQGKDGKGSLKSLERVLGTLVANGEAHTRMSVLHGLYELRGADAHLPRSELDSGFTLAGIDPSLTFNAQGFCLLSNVVACLEGICSILDVRPSA